LNTCKGKELMYKIIPTKGEGFSVNESHILSLKNTTTKKIVNIELKDYLKQTKTFKHLHKLYRVPVKFPKKVTPIIDPYFLGLWLGDGDKTNTRITTKDKEIIKYLKGYSKKLKLQLSTYDYKNRCPSYAITSGKQGRNNKQYCLYKKMKDMKLLFNDKHIPFIYKVNSRKNRLSLLAGLIDSDGYITGKNKTGHEITLTNKKLAEDIVYLCRSLGFLSYIREKIATIKSINYKTKAYRISIIGDCTAIPVKLKRKKAKKRKINKDPLVTGFKVKKLKVDNYYGFFLDGDHLHLIDSFIVNHNTHIAMNIIKQLIAQGKKPRYVGREPGSRFIEIALQLGIKEEDFEYIEYCPDPTKLEFEKNDIIIIDWLLPKDYAKTDKTFDDLTLLLQKHKAFMFTFVQIRDNGNWFAPDLIEFFPALSAKYLYDDDENTLFGHFSIYKIRAGRRVTPKRNVPCRYDWETKLLVRIEDEINNKVIEKKPDEDGTGDLKDEKVVD